MYSTNTEHSTIDHLEIENLDRVRYPVMEHFYTIQGEGVHTGKPAYFIRLAGCDVGCWWCDVKESWDKDQYPDVEVSELVKASKKSGTNLVVITGGEPLLHNLDALTIRLKQEHFKVHIETSGSSPVSGSLDWITLSPKRFKKPLDEIFPYVDELKVIVLTNKDLKWAEENALKCPENTRLLLQPEWSTPKSRKIIIDYVKAHPKWSISLQTHKYLNVR